MAKIGATRDGMFEMPLAPIRPRRSAPLRVWTGEGNENSPIDVRLSLPEGPIQNVRLKEGDLGEASAVWIDRYTVNLKVEPMCNDGVSPFVIGYGAFAAISRPQFDVALQNRLIRSMSPAIPE